MKNIIIVLLVLIAGILLLSQIGIVQLSKTTVLKQQKIPEQGAEKSIQDTKSNEPDDKQQNNRIVAARDATVSIKSDLGKGAGFFITSNCYILTNKHVVQFNEKTLGYVNEELDSATESLRELGDIIADKQQAFMEQCSDCSEQAREEFVSKETQAYEELAEVLSETEDKIYELNNNLEFEVSLSNDKKYTAELIRLSEDYDLALMKIDHDNCNYLQAGDENSLDYGDKIYAIGNPSGFGHTISSGVFSRIEGSDSKRMIQTDASVNPGNSGGPLVNEEGRVFGVVSLKRMDLEGIAFAIPISIALEEFNEYLN